ncbi:hypothetical protein MTX80_18150 [Gordonia amicalis]|nr:hypothetical protein [Gordonia amicalis]UOG23640.1 hypothetical protein MTX80_18150 [Gordonia amicalis]
MSTSAAMISSLPIRLTYSEGPQSSRTPVVPCPKAIVVQPPGGGSPFGVTTIPETTVGDRSRPDVDRYSTRLTIAPSSVITGIGPRGGSSTSSTAPGRPVSAAPRTTGSG